ncbi:MAG: SRPBCC family protein [Bacteroidota bacterium]
MKYTSIIDLNLPIEKVIELFDNPDNMYQWQPELTNFEHLSGDPGQPGAKSKLTYQNGKRTVEMTETVLVRELPEEFSGTYEMKGVINHINNSFETLADGKTRWTVISDFQFSGIMGFLSIFMKGMFKKQTMTFMQRFKDFAENT